MINFFARISFPFLVHYSEFHKMVGMEAEALVHLLGQTFLKLKQVRRFGIKQQ